MTVMAEALVRATRDGVGMITSMEFGILEWPYADLEPVQALVVKHGLRGEPNDPMFLIVMMNDDESVFEVPFQADESIRRYAETIIKQQGSINIARLPSMYGDLVSDLSARKIRNYTVPARVFEKSTDAIVALCEASKQFAS